MISGEICLKPLRVSTAVIVEFPASLSTNFHSSPYGYNQSNKRWMSGVQCCQSYNRRSLTYR